MNAPRVGGATLLAAGLAARLAARAALVALAFTALLFATGCASTQPTSASDDPAGVTPADLAIEIRVEPGRGVENRAKVEERRARFAVLPDGSMFGEADVVPREGVRPARVRRLAREQLGDLWATLRAAGFADPALADTRSNPTLFTPAAGEILATLEVHASGDRFTFVRRYTPAGEDEPAMRRVVRSVASLAWASDEVLVESAELPKRYDLGVDPYARFARKPDAPKVGAPSAEAAPAPAALPEGAPTKAPPATSATPARALPTGDGK